MIQTEYDVVIIGAGPAGLIAALECYTRDRNILVLEKMHKPALKLKITGKGRCNITNAAGLMEFISHFGKNGRFLKYAFSEFFNIDLLKYFERYGVKFKLERGQRYFPQNDKAIEIANVLLNQVKKLKIPLFLNSKVKQIKKEPDGDFRIIVNGKSIKAKQILIATGGKSYPKTGSTGDGYEFAAKLGHTITPLSPSLVPVQTGGDIANKLDSLNLKNVSVKVVTNGKKIDEQFGELLFTETGVSGPTILSLSHKIVRLLKNEQNISVSIDLKPALDYNKVDQRILREISTFGKRGFTWLLKELLPIKMIPVFLEILKIPADKKLSEINKNERKKLRNLLKDFDLQIIGYSSFDEAIITAGGVSINEINPQTMESKIVNGLYFAGEIIDINGDTGGFNLQAAFSTGWVAGRAIKETCNHSAANP